MAPEGKKGLTVYFDQALYNRVAAAAKADRRSMANWIEAACDAIAPHQLGTRIMFATRIEPTLVFDDEFHEADNRLSKVPAYFIRATEGDDNLVFVVPRTVLSDKIGNFTMASAIKFCEHHRPTIEAACRMALSFGPPKDRPIILSARDFQ